VAIHRIEVADPVDGDAIRAALRERGLVVVKRNVTDVTGASDAALIILAADAPGGLATLAGLRAVAGTATVPVILLGSPEGTVLDAARASLRGADGWYARPVPLERLARKVETFLAPAESRLRAVSEPVLTPPPLVLRAGAVVPEAAPLLAPPERTLRLDADGQPIMASAILPPPARLSSAALVTPVAPEASAIELGEYDSAPRDAQPPPPLASDISPLLAAVLIAADARVFPGAAPLDLSFAAGDGSPEKLVPDELLEDLGASFEMPDEDPLESFTHIGPVVPQTGTPAPLRTPGSAVSASRTPGPFTPRSSRFERTPPVGPESSDPLAHGGGTGLSTAGSAPPPASRDADHDEHDAPVITTTSARVARGGSQVHRRSTVPPPVRGRGSVMPVPPEPSFGELGSDGQSRVGTVGDAGLVAVFASIGIRRLDGLLSVSLLGSRALEARLSLRDGEVRVLAGDVARRVVAQLRRERRASEELTDEADAEALLARRVESGALAPFDLARRLGRAREELLFDLLAAASARFTLTPLQPEQLALLDDQPRPFARPLLALVVEGARRRLDAARVARLLGPGSVRVSRTPELAALSIAAGVPPELTALLTPAAGATLEALAAAAPPEEGVSGAVYALVCAGGLRVEAAPVASDASGAAAERARRELAALASIAEDADYFVVLGLGRDAQPRELHAAHEARARVVRGLPLADLGLEALEPVRDAVLAALDDALDVLGDDRLRARYASALGAP
jgi:hypothetical protein